MHPRIMAQRTMAAQQAAVGDAATLAEILGMGEEQPEALRAAMATNRPELKVLRMSEAVAAFLKAAVESLTEPDPIEKPESPLLGFLPDEVRAQVFEKFDSPDALRSATIDDLVEINGIGPSKAARIVESVLEAFGGSDE